MNQTSNYQLSQWDPEDRILRTDFNSDNSKIDAALAKICLPYFTSYHGDGAASQTITFPGNPLLVMIIGGSVLMVAIRGVDTANLTYKVTSHRDLMATWTENSLTWRNSGGDNIYMANDSNQYYYVFALLSKT